MTEQAITVSCVWRAATRLNLARPSVWPVLREPPPLLQAPPPLKTALVGCVCVCGENVSLKIAGRMGVWGRERECVCVCEFMSTYAFVHLLMCKEMKALNVKYGKCCHW